MYVTLAIIRDLSIILLAIESLVVGVILAVLLLQIRDLVLLMRQELRPLIQSTQETADTVRSTTQFVSKRVAAPGIEAASFVAGVRQGFRTLKSGIVGGTSSTSTPQASSEPAPPPAPPTQTPGV